MAAADAEVAKAVETMRGMVEHMRRELAGVRTSGASAGAWSGDVAVLRPATRPHLLHSPAPQPCWTT
jgi:hypothetical protein